MMMLTFVDRLGVALFKAKTRVWIDRWELRVGDSLIRRIEEEIDRCGCGDVLAGCRREDRGQKGIVEPA